MSTAEIIAELPRLSNAELVQVAAKLRELIDSDHITSDKSGAPNPARIYSPRLAHREQLKDFAKQVLELEPDAKV